MITAVALTLLLAAPLPAEEAVPAPPAGPSTPDDTEVDPAEPDFTLINLPTTLRLPRRKLAFRITHRFARPLGRGDFGDLASDLFGFDGGAQVGLELRYGLTSRAQVGVYRTSDRTISLYAQQELLRQDRSPVGLAALASVEGLDNFQEEHSPRFGVVASRKLGNRGALYAVPAWVGNTNLLFPEGDDWTLVLGLGARVRITSAMALVAEASPRLAGFKTPDGATLVAFGIEHRVGGHSFQINVSNDIKTTPADLARGRQSGDEWFLGFNISRKFY